MDGYYDHVPLVELRHPLVITSPLRELTRAVTYRVSSLLGLPFHDIDRLIEHRSGRTLEQLLLEEGVVAYRDTEATCLEKVLEQRPSGMIALGDQDRPLPGRHDRAESSRFSVLILDLELAILYWRIQSTARARESTQWHPLFEGLPQSLDDLRPYWLDWRRSQGDFDQRIAADNLSVKQIGEQMQEWILESAAVE